MTESSLWQKFKRGLQKTTRQVEEGLRTVFKNHKIDETSRDALEEVLIQADMGVAVAQKLCERLQEQRYESVATEGDFKRFLVDQIIPILAPCEKDLDTSLHKPFVILVVGVNGSGKTTSIAKLAQRFLQQNLRVELAACDTFRAAAVEQLRVWAERANVPIHTTRPQGDAAGLAFEAMTKAKENQADVLLIDTAGRLHNKVHLMEELKKIVRVIKKIDSSAPHETLLVLDGTTGQNALQQMSVFSEEAQVTGLIITKLDGTARAGFVVGLAEKVKLPIYGIGVGEQMDDMHPFDARAFAHHLLGYEP